jgi:hypothetical protein
MHLQNSVQGWLSAVVALPDYACIKAFDAGLLADARAAWGAAGRDQAKLYCILRHFTDHYPPFDGSYSWQDHLAWWRAFWAGTFDGTYLSRYVDTVNAVETLNEHTDQRMVTDKALLAPHLLTEQAAVSVWQDTYRGKLLPAATQLILFNGPEGNSLPIEAFQLAHDSGERLGYHPYIATWQGQRITSEWPFVSGRWDADEQEYGIPVDWAFTETGPLAGADGWRATNCCAAEQTALVSVFREWVQLVRGTAAYRQGRIMGPGCWFTSGHLGWETFQLDTPQLIAIAQMMAEEWRPPMTDQAKLAQAIADANTVITDTTRLLSDLNALVEVQPLYSAKALIDLALRDKDGNPTTDPVLAPTGAPAGVVKAGTIVPVYAVGVTAGSYTNRATVTVDGKSVWGAATALAKV